MARKKKEEVKEEEVKTATKGKGKGKGKKAKEETPAEEPKTKGKGKGKKAKEEEKTKSNRGRKAGMRNVITDKDSEAIQSQFEGMETEFDALAEDIELVIEKSNKSAIASARKRLQVITKMIKPFRATLQSAKQNMKSEKIK